MNEKINLPPEEELQRFLYVEDREDLFQTKLLQIKHETGIAEPRKDLLVVSRDPGSANALVPVMKSLNSKDGVSMLALIDGRAQEIIQKQFETTDVSPQGMMLESDLVIGDPDLIFADASSEGGIENYSASTFQGTPIILLEDYYTNSFSFLEAARNRTGHWPEKICVMDEEARRMIVEKFPEMANKIEVTGQPSFDRFAHENSVETRDSVRKSLSLLNDEKLVSYMTGTATASGIRELEAVATKLSAIAENFVFAFRKHPRDNTPYETYYDILNRHNIKYVNVEQFTTDQVGIASDLVITTWSTVGLDGVYRRKPTLHFIDKDYIEDLPTGYIPPPVKLGASIGVDDIDDLNNSVQELLKSNNALKDDLNRNMDKYYPNDGKNAERVSNVILSTLRNTGQQPS